MQCNFTKKALEDKGIEPEIIDIRENPEAGEILKRENISSVPVLMDDKGAIIAIGFQREIIRAL